MIKVGITGGIGSGKTTAARIFEALHIPVFYADDESKALLDDNEGVKSALKSAFGEELYASGKMDRAMLASKIFNNKEAIAKVNAIVHPAVAERFNTWCAAQSAPYILKEAAILFETGSYKELDQNIVVVADEHVRIERVMARNGWTQEEVRARMKNQWPDQQKIDLADFVIYNEQKEMLTPQILKIHEDLIGRANQSSR